MSADFWASYLSGAIGICIGNKLDIWKTELQAGNRYFTSTPEGSDLSALRKFTSLFRGAAAPILSYGALNSILFLTYNRSLTAMDPSISDYTKLAGVSLGHIWLAGAVGGLACWVVSAPSELVKCRTQLAIDGHGSSTATVREIWRRDKIRGMYLGGTVTSLRDSIGYGWYFWTYELSKRLLMSRQPDPFMTPSAFDVLVSGGIAGVVTWATVYPLDVVKTRIQTQSAMEAEQTSLLSGEAAALSPQRTSFGIARDIFKTEGVAGFYRGIGVCSLRAFIVNAAQWFVYEKVMSLLSIPKIDQDPT